MISFAQRQTTAHRNREKRAAMVQLLARAKAILSRWDRLHSMSVTIGRMERIAESGIVEVEISGCRTLVEQADRLCADIDRLSLGVESAANLSKTGNGDGAGGGIVAGETSDSQQG